MQVHLAAVIFLFSSTQSCGLTTRRTHMGVVSIFHLDPGIVTDNPGSGLALSSWCELCNRKYTTEHEPSDGVRVRF